MTTKRLFLIVKVDAAKQKQFDKHLTQPIPITFSDYGVILHSGWGEGPDAGLRRKLNEKYGLYES